MVLKDLDYQLGTLLFQEELQADALYFDQIPEVISYQNHQFKVISKELKRVQNAAEPENLQRIIVKVVTVA
jgi:hypothetical protein